MRGGLRAATVVLLAALALLLTSASAWADDCTPLDVTCAVEDALSGGGAPVPTEDPVGTVEDTAAPVRDEVQRQIDDLLGRTGDPPPGGGGGGSGGGHQGSGGGSHDRRGGTGGGRIDPIEPRVVIEVGSGAVPDPTSSSHGAPGERHVPSLLGALQTNAVASLTFWLMLLAVAGGFVIVQDKLDRNDPKLVIAPVESDVVTFE
jgi:hypothetical protein